MHFRILKGDEIFDRKKQSIIWSKELLDQINSSTIPRYENFHSTKNCCFDFKLSFLISIFSFFQKILTFFPVFFFAAKLMIENVSLAFDSYCQLLEIGFVSEWRRTKKIANKFSEKRKTTQSLRVVDEIEKKDASLSKSCVWMLYISLSTSDFLFRDGHSQND